MKTVLALLLLLTACPAPAESPDDAVEESFKNADQLIETGQYARARRELDAALDGVLAELKRDDPRLARYHERVGATWLRQDKIPEARAAFTAALKAIPRRKLPAGLAAKAYTGIGLCLRREKKDAYALRFFEEALKLPVDESIRTFAEEQIREIEGAR